MIEYKDNYNGIRFRLRKYTSQTAKEYAYKWKRKRI